MGKQLRLYQRRIVDSIGRWNAIVKMPTGSGKTVVAAQLVVNCFELSNNAKTLFLVPTQDLVEQQALVVEEWCRRAEVLRFTGGMADPIMSPSRNTCLVSTPKAFLLLQQRKNEFSWKHFGLVVFDEGHHVLKDHPYRHIALRIKRFLEHELPPHRMQIVGMSASLTYAVNDSSIKRTLDRICRELKIEKMISPLLQELEEGGYIAPHGRNVEVERATDLPEGLIPRTMRKPHEMYRQFMQRVKTNTATDFTQAYWQVIFLEIEIEAKKENHLFESPLHQQKLSSWEDYVYCMASSSNGAVVSKLQHWYVGLRLLVQTWEEEQHLVLAWLQMNDAFNISVHESKDYFQWLKIQAEAPADFLKMDRFRFHLRDKRQLKAEAFRCLVFVQQRITAVILSHFINHDSDLRGLGLKADFVAARNSNIAPGISVTKSKANASIENFRTGATNVIVATSVLEEGFDVPAANVVISYDHLKDSVELCQRFGRARHEESSIVVLDERHDRPLEMLESVHSLQETIAQQYDPRAANSSANNQDEETRQRSRERNASQSVLMHKQNEATHL